MRAFLFGGVLALTAGCAIACGSRASLELAKADAAPVDATTDAGEDASEDATMLDSSFDTSADTSFDVVDEATDAPPDVDSCTIHCVPAPRPLAPLSTSRATSQHPTFHWALAAGTTGAHVDICRDRECTLRVTSFDAVGSSGAPPILLSPGVYFWSLRGMAGGDTGALPSPTWELFIGAGNAVVDTSWGTSFDANGDGNVDLVTSNVPGGPNVVYYYLGSAHGLAQSAVQIPMPALGFGFKVASAGDVDGDGYPELITPSGQSLLLYAGGPIGPSAKTIVPTATSVIQSIAPAGDVDGDGYGDFVISALASQQTPGVAYVFRGGPGGLSATPIALPDPAPNLDKQYGFNVSAGDVNGDGYSDVIVGAGLMQNGVVTSVAYVYAGGPNGPSAVPAVVIGQGAFPGIAAAAGDTNGDGYDDVVVTSESGGANGIVEVFAGGASGVSSTSIVIPAPNAYSSGTQGNFGALVSALGDVNGDGFDDLVVNDAPHRTGGVQPVASSYLFLGGASGITTTLFWFGGNMCRATGVGDVSGDRRADLVGQDGCYRNTVLLGGATQVLASSNLVGGPSVY